MESYVRIRSAGSKQWAKALEHIEASQNVHHKVCRLCTLAIIWMVDVCIVRCACAYIKRIPLMWLLLILCFLLAATKRRGLKSTVFSRQSFYLFIYSFRVFILSHSILSRRLFPPQRYYMQAPLCLCMHSYCDCKHELWSRKFKQSKHDFMTFAKCDETKIDTLNDFMLAEWYWPNIRRRRLNTKSRKKSRQPQFAKEN